MNRLFNRQNNWLTLLCVILLSPCLSACTDSNQTSPPKTKSTATKGSVFVGPTFDEVLALAAEHERLLDDGWFYGQSPRVFKTGYGAASAAVKAHFAVDLAAMLANEKQDLLADWHSYVPYAKRGEFAYTWWMNKKNDGEFVRQDRKTKTAWIHEALLDGSELWWRALEKKNGAGLFSAAVLAHDAEQKLVFDYADAHGCPRSFSDEYARFAH